MADQFFGEAYPEIAPGQRLKEWWAQKNPGGYVMGGIPQAEQGPVGFQNDPIADAVGAALTGAVNVGANTVSAIGQGIAHTDEVLNQMLLDFGVDPAVAFMISNPYDSVKQLSAVGMGGGDPRFSDNVPADLTVPQEILDQMPGFPGGTPGMPAGAAPGVLMAQSAPLQDRIRAPIQQDFLRPEGPDFSRVEAALGEMSLTEPVAPTDRELLQAGLAGGAAGAAQGQTPGQIIALAAAGMFNARDMKKTAYDEALERYELKSNENARIKAQALAQIETAQAEFDRTVALAENQFNQNAAEMALRHDIADAQDKLNQMQLLQPQFHNLGNGMGAIVTRTPDGQMNVSTVELDPLQRKLATVLAQANLQRALRGDHRSDKTSVAIKVGGITSTFDQNDPMTPFLTMATVGLSNPNDPRAKMAIDMATSRLQQRYGGLDEDGEEPEALEMYRTLKPDEYAADLESMATMIYATSLMAEQGQPGAPK